MAPLLDVLRSVAGLDAPLAPFSTAEGCTGALLLARIGPLMAAWQAAIERDDSAGRRWLAGAGAGFVASLCVGGLFVPFVIVALVATARAWRSLATAAGVLVLAVAMAALWPRGPDPGLLDATKDPVAETLEWSRRDNAFWTRYWAERWSSRETQPGPGHLALARASWALGHEEDARRIAAQLATSAADPGTRKEAAAALAVWGAHR